MKCKIFLLTSASEDAADRMEKKISEFLRSVDVGFLAQSGPLGGSAISFSLASSSSGGGHYFSPTGAIATGLVQLVRGLTRLCRGSGG